jgi:hypothetical protein
MVHTNIQTHKLLCEPEDCTVIWNQRAHTDREVIANRPDIIIEDKREKTCVLINVTIPENRNFVQQELEKN